MKRISAAMALAAVTLASPAMSQQAAPPVAPDAPMPTARTAGPPQSSSLADGPWDIQTGDAKLHVEVVTRGLDHPWSMAFLPDGSMLVTERPGRLRVIRNGVLDPKPIEGLPAIFAPGIAGLTDVVLDPDFARNRLIYIAYSKADPAAGPNPSPANNSTLAVMRAKWDGGARLTEVKDIFIADSWYGKTVPERCCGQGPAFGSYGGRLAFMADGTLLVSSGDRNYGEMVQKGDNHFGKIMRITTDGAPVQDNPYVDRAGWKPEIWSIGHRNPTGMTIDPATGTVWESEFGPRGGDEINRITRGGNYGWIDVTQGYHYNGEPAKATRRVAGMIDPVFAFGPPSHNPGNLVVYRGSAFPQWQGDLLVAMMNRSLVRFKLSPEGNVVGQEVMLQQLGQRLRDVHTGPDGAIYILTDETAGALLKVTPGT